MKHFEIKKLSILIFSFIWRYRLKGIHWHPKATYPAKVIKIKGWRTAIIDPPLGSRRTVTFLFDIFGFYI